MLKVEVDKILPVTDARANIARLVDDVCKGNIYVLTRGGKPAVMVAPIDYLNKPEANVETVKSKPKVNQDLVIKGDTSNLPEKEEKKEKLPAGIDLDKVENALSKTNNV